MIVFKNNTLQVYVYCCFEKSRIVFPPFKARQDINYKQRSMSNVSHPQWHMDAKLEHFENFACSTSEDKIDLAVELFKTINCDVLIKSFIRIFKRHSPVLPSSQREGEAGLCENISTLTKVPRWSGPDLVRSR